MAVCLLFAKSRRPLQPFFLLTWLFPRSRVLSAPGDPVLPRLTLSPLFLGSDYVTELHCSATYPVSPKAEPAETFYCPLGEFCWKLQVQWNEPGPSFMLKDPKIHFKWHWASGSVPCWVNAILNSEAGILGIITNNLMKFQDDKYLTLNKVKTLVCFWKLEERNWEINVFSQVLLLEKYVYFLYISVQSKITEKFKILIQFKKLCCLLSFKKSFI